MYVHNDIIIWIVFYARKIFLPLRRRFRYLFQHIYCLFLIYTTQNAESTQKELKLNKI